MPLPFPIQFRRKSSANLLETIADQPVQSSFRVIQRPSQNASDPRTDQTSSAKKITSGRPVIFSLRTSSAKSVENLASFTNRASAGTTYSGSSGHFDTSASSARHSSTSTLPSSFDDIDNGELYPTRKTQAAVAVAVPAPAADTAPTHRIPRKLRGFSLGLRSQRDSVVSTTPVPDLPLRKPSAPFMSVRGSVSQPPSPPQLNEQLGRRDFYTGRDRAMTASSYASTARPPQLDSTLDEQGFGADFGNMFEGLAQSKDRLPKPPSQIRATTGPVHSAATPESVSTVPSPVVPRSASAASRRYSWESRDSCEQLMSAPQSDVGSPSRETDHSPFAQLGLSSGYQQLQARTSTPSVNGDVTTYEKVASPTSPARQARSQTSEEQLVWRSQLRRPTGEKPPTSVGVGLPTSTSDNDITPKPNKVVLMEQDDIPLFDESPTGSATRTISPRKQREQTELTPKRMTRIQYEQAQRQSASKIRQSIVVTAAGQDDDAKSVDSSTEEADDLDDADRQRNMARQRARQEATMSVYRQQMKKVTGGPLSDLPSQQTRPHLFERSSTSGLSLSGLGSTFSATNLGGTSPVGSVEVDEDEDVPLGILQAHGFPNRNRPPSIALGAGSGYTASVAGNDAGDGLPAFARRLPQDPYFSAGLVSPTNRESLACGSGSTSPVPQPGGLVGIIAGEEKAKAARRGSVNPLMGNTSPMPLPANVGGRLYDRSHSMASLNSLSPQMPISGLIPGTMGLPGPAPLSQLEQAQMSTQQQMAQLMEMQTRMMQQMMAMQSGMSPQMMQQFSMLPNSLPGSSMGDVDPRRMSVSPTLANQGRSMSMMAPPPQWNLTPRASVYAGSIHGMSASPPAGYTPSIAPSERSTVGMPSRYRPVSTVDPGATANNKATAQSRSMTMASLTGRLSPSASQVLSPLSATTGNASKSPQRPSIRMLDSQRSVTSPRQSSLLQYPALEQDEDDEAEDAAGWAEMAKKREAIKTRRLAKYASQEALAVGLSDMIYNVE